MSFYIWRWLGKNEVKYTKKARYRKEEEFLATGKAHKACDLLKA